MIRRAPMIIVASAVLLAIGCSSNRLPSAAENALQNSSSFELLSLDPNPRDEAATGEGFHGWNILGSTVIKSSDTRTQLIAQFKAGVADNDGSVAACFNPRHGIKVTHDGKTHEFVICFECYSVAWFIDGGAAEGFLITDLPQPTFDEVLTKLNVPLAEKP